MVKPMHQKCIHEILGKKKVSLSVFVIHYKDFIKMCTVGNYSFILYWSIP